MQSKMKEVMCYCLLLRAAAIGSTGAECIAVDRRNLICKFPFNLNSTGRDFGVYFYPDDGGEEPLVDCAWVKSELRCIKQEDFECKHMVSDIAKITIPKSFGDRNGTYRCVPEGHMHHTVKSCRLPHERDRIPFAACDLKATLGVHEVIVMCIFSLPVDSFTVKKDTTVVGSFTKSLCQNSTVCQYSNKGEQEIFSVMLNLNQNQYGNYFCHADHPSLYEDIKGCTFSNYQHNEESSSVPVHAVVLPLVGVLTVIGVAVTVFYKLKQRRKAAKNMKKKRELILNSHDENV